MFAPVAVLLSASVSVPAAAKTLIDYFQPTPIVCPLTSNTWGAAAVLPRDVCNGLEDSTNASWQYWDGKILQGADGKFHMYAGRWPQNKGFADWPNSVIVEAVSNSTLIGSYVPLTTTPFSGKEQNVSGIVLNNGSYALIDSPGNIYTATSLTGTWASLGAISVTANGSTISTQTTENQSLWQSADGSFLIISRSFQEMTSASNIVGPYIIQATIPNLQSQGYEDPVVWCSGGQYHLIVNMYNARKANHFTSADGIHNWVDQGLAYDPTTDFIRYTDGTVNHWYKIERPGVFMQGGHVSAFTFAVIDVDKTLDLANDTHGTKIIVVPFDGVSFDRENPGPGSAACPADVDGGTAGSGGAGGAGGGSGSGGAGGRGGTAGSAGRGGSAGAVGGSAGGSAGRAGTGGTGGGAGRGGTVGAAGTGGTSGTNGAAGTRGAAGTGGDSGPGGSPGTGGSSAGTRGDAGGSGVGTGSGGAVGGSGGTLGAATGGDGSSGGCSCDITPGPDGPHPALFLLLSAIVVSTTRRRRVRLGSSERVSR
jgi:hypothetical protein